MATSGVTVAEAAPGLWRGSFHAMASPCEVLVEGGARRGALRTTRRVAAEAWRVERKWSRYRDDSIVQRINRAEGRAVRVDDETADMLDYAAELWRLSAGRFDITAGVLRRAWRFDGSDRIPAPDDVAALVAALGWQRVDWQRPSLRLPAGMEIDFGGIGKEYAVDRALRIARAQCKQPLLLNFGGDLASDGPRRDGSAWQVGISPIGSEDSGKRIALQRGGVATSGDAHRFLLHDGRRYGHVLDATTGWPAPGAPHAVTVAASSCTLAGMLATLAMLQGDQAKAFLEAQQLRFLIQ
jgi:thiamine biosynthesis lipoprotein